MNDQLMYFYVAAIATCEIFETLYKKIEFLVSTLIFVLGSLGTSRSFKYILKLMCLFFGYNILPTIGF